MAGAAIAGILAVLGLAPIPVLGSLKVIVLLACASVLCSLVAHAVYVSERHMRALNEMLDRAEKTELGVRRLDRLVSARMIGEQARGPRRPLRAVAGQMDDGVPLLGLGEEGQVVDMDAVRRSVRRSGVPL